LARPNDAASKMPIRIGYVYTPNGIIRERWMPATSGAKFDMPDILQQWEPFRNQLLIISNLNNGDSESISGHVGGSSMFLTGVEPNKSLSEIRCGISVDQIIAQKFGGSTSLGSLQLCIENAAELAGQSAGGYSSAYTNTISWSSPTTPLPMEHRPREIFDRLFGSGGTDKTARGKEIRRQHSILDFVKEDTSRYLKKLGNEDSHKLNEYLDAVRDVENRVQMAELNSGMELPEMQRPVSVPSALDAHHQLMYDLLLLAFQTDMTRVFTFMIAREYSELVYTHLGHQDPYHPLTHHQGNERKKRQAGEVDVYHASLFGKFLERMSSTKDSDGSSLLDNSILVYGAGLGDGDVHSQWNVPIALIGGGGNIQGGRHIQVKLGTPLCNLHVAILNKLDIPTQHFGSSTGELDLSASA